MNWGGWGDRHSDQNSGFSSSLAIGPRASVPCWPEVTLVPSLPPGVEQRNSLLHRSQQENLLEVSLL